MTYNAAEVLCHLGFGFGSFAEAQLGMLWEETAIVPVTPSKPKPRKKEQPAQVPSSGGGGSSWLHPESPVFELTEISLEQLASRIKDFAQSPELQTWTSSVLSTAGRNGTDLSTEKSLARTLLKEVQRTDFPLPDRTARALYLVSGLVAIGLPSALVAHGEVALTRALAAVYADGAWAYADPNGDFDLGQLHPFLKEKIFQIPNLAKPVVEDVRKYKEQIDQLTAQLAASQKLVLDLASQILSEIHAPSIHAIKVVERDKTEWIYKAVAIGAVTLLALALWELHKTRRESS